ncbi:hypothetical protein LCGC14_1548560 [marine sediment metagenome]|uniref:Uncharacterized protein n=1 Tax=marine sediment metagenome TaxID=412755 RepID=A0A0F9IR24_9ZZZZ
MTVGTRKVYLAGGLLVVLSWAAQGAEITGYEPLSDWADLPRAKTDVRAGMASSYDPLGGNLDFNYYQWPEGHRTDDTPTIVTEIQGPGVITRFWMPHAAANAGFPVKISIDGVLLIDTNSDSLLGGSYGYMNGPLVQTLIGGQVSYEPIPFASTLKIESYNYAAGGWAKTHHYYQYGYRLLGPGQTVASYTGTLSPAQQADRATAVSIINNAGSNPAAADPSAIVLSQPAQSIPPGGTLALADLTGNGRIRRLNLKMAGATDAQLDGLTLRVRYDGQGSSAIDVPVAHFFGAGHERTAYKSVPLGTDGPDGFYSYWPMPFRGGVTVELVNQTASAIGIDSAAVEYVRGGVSNGDGYLHAAFNEGTLAGSGESGRYHQLLAASGAGHYVGNLLYLQRAGTNRNILEGDDVIIVDGREDRTLYGTGAEDAYNGGYYYDHVLVQSEDPPESGIGPFHGLLHMDDADFGDDFVRTDQYRWLIADAVGFTEGIQVRMEHYRNGTDALFGSTAFYYLIPDAAVAGDANFDGVVNITDLGIVASNWQAIGTYWTDGDFSENGVVNITDLGALASNWQHGVGGSIQTVPEPAVTWLVVFGVGMLAGIRRGRWTRRGG